MDLLFNYLKTVDKSFRLQIFKKNGKVYHIERARSADLNEVAHYEPPHQDLRCLHIQLFSSLVLKDLSGISMTSSITVLKLLLLKRGCN